MLRKNKHEKKRRIRIQKETRKKDVYNRDREADTKEALKVEKQKRMKLTETHSKEKYKKNKQTSLKRVKAAS